jgi:hypothetical protein
MIQVTSEMSEVKALEIGAVAAYLLEAGWQEIPHPNQNLRFFQGAQDYAGNPIDLVLPRSTEFWDSAILLAKAINLVAAIEERSALEVMGRMRSSLKIA